MQVTIPMQAGLTLQIGDRSHMDLDYPSSLLQKGLILVFNGKELAEEGVGFGVPVYKSGHRSIFPGAIELSTQVSGNLHHLTALFKMNLEERISRRGKSSLQNKTIYRIKDNLAWLLREVPALRAPLTKVSNSLRAILRWETTYEEIPKFADVKTSYAVNPDSGILEMKFEWFAPVEGNITEVIVMNEQGARYFNRYRDSDGNYLQDDQIGIWDAVTAQQAFFISDQHHLAFGLRQEDGARLFRGRELVGDRLAWVGFGYSFAPEKSIFRCTLKIEGTP